MPSRRLLPPIEVRTSDIRSGSSTVEQVTKPAELAEQLAQALDDDYYETAAVVMAPDVVYRIREVILTGPVEVADSYRSASQMAHHLFDEVGYSMRSCRSTQPHSGSSMATSSL